MLEDLVEKVDNLSEQMKNFGRKMETIKRLKTLVFVQRVKGFHSQRKETIKHKKRIIRGETCFQNDQ